MKLSALANRFFAGWTLALLINVLFLLAITSAFSNAQRATDRRTESLGVVDALRHETELLGRLVRAYVATANPRYLLYYYDILAIRQGEKSGPKFDQNNLFWEDVIAGRRPYEIPRTGPPQSLMQRMQRSDFTLAEQTALLRVIEATETLKRTEQIAFAATQGLYDRSRMEYVSEGEPDREFADSLVYSKEYEQGTAALAGAIERLRQLTVERTALEVNAAAARLSNLVKVQLAVDLILLVAIGLIMRLTRRQILKPIQQMANVAARFARGDYGERARLGQQGLAEFNALSGTLSRMAEAIESDLAARTMVQHQLELANQKAEAATSAKSMFLANMSHEIRTPMNAIIGMTYLVLDSELKPGQRDYIQKAHDAANGLLGIINDVLDFSKIEAGKLEVESAPCCLEEIVDRSLMLVRGNAAEKGLSLLYEYDESVLLDEVGHFLGDSLRLGQVLNNPLSNAVKFTEDGHIKLKISLPSLVEIDNRRQGSLNISIEDTGIGMTPEQRGRLFQDFSQADGSISRRYGGTGLGLSIAAQLIDLMGGAIEVCSEAGRGSEFIVTLPVELMQPVVTSSTQIEHRVLVVGARSLTRDPIVSQLRAIGVGHTKDGLIEAVADAEAALECLGRNEPPDRAFDVVLMSSDLPDSDQQKLWARASADWPAGTRLVVIAPLDSTLRHNPRIATGIASFLEPTILLSEVRQVLLRKPCGCKSDGPTDDVAQPLQGLRVLLAEDNLVNQLVAGQVLGRAGAGVELANNGQEALDRLEAQGVEAFDVVLMDMQMPVLDGAAATQLIRARPEWNDLPIIALTANAMFEEREQCLALGMQGHIAKPFEPAQLIRALVQFVPKVNVVGEPASGVNAARQTTTPIQSYPAWPGIDCAAGEAFCDGEGSFRQGLAQFLDHTLDAPTRLQALFSAGERADLKREAHSYRLAAGS